MAQDSSSLTDHQDILVDDPVQRRYKEYCLARAQRQKENTEIASTAASRKQLLADQRALLDTPRWVTTRKEHLCTKCQTPIPAGSHVVVVTCKVRVWISRYECKNQHTTHYYCNNCKKTTV
ncbi:MAG: hypothetical protein FWG55_04870 [Candidatus Bathyarchaeota archaeon]|jgi:hypothetical protein|nr:hypothetical protein [Candidatus Termiticorpusculum sp.]